MDLQTLHHNQWVRRAAWTIGSVAALWAVSWLAVPPLLKHQAQKIASEKLGRTVTLGAVDFKPWSLELTGARLAVATADGKADQLRIRRIYIDSALQSLVRLAPVMDAIAVDEPVAHLNPSGGRSLDIDDILTKLAPPADAAPGEPAKFALYNLALNGGSFRSSTPVGKTHTLRDVRLAVPFLSNLDSSATSTPIPCWPSGSMAAPSTPAPGPTPFARRARPTRSSSCSRCWI